MAYLQRYKTTTRCLCAASLLFVLGCTSGGSGNESTAQLLNDQKAKAQTLMDAGQYQQAVTTLLPLAQKQIKNAQLYAMLAESYWRLGNYTDATRNYEASLRIDYGNPEVLVDFATMLMEMGRTGRALTEFENAIKSNEQDPLPHYNYGLALYELGRVDDALAQWEIAYRIDPRNLEVTEALGIGFTGVNDDKAAEYFTAAASLGANSAQFHNNYGQLLRRLGDLPQATREFEHALELDEGNAWYRLNLALTYMQSRLWLKAIPLWNSLVADDGQRRTYRIYYARALYETRQYRAAIDALEDWLLAQKDDADEGASWSKFDEQAADDVPEPTLDEGYDVLAMSYRGLENLDKATRYIERAVALAPDNTVHLNNYGVILAESGNIVAAKAQWRKVLDLEPDNATARQNLSAVGE